jgi:hypothetical protein
MMRPPLSTAFPIEKPVKRLRVWMIRKKKIVPEWLAGATARGLSGGSHRLLPHGHKGIAPEGRRVDGAGLHGAVQGKAAGALRGGRAGRWFLEHDWVDAFDFVGEVGASDLVPEVVGGQLFRTARPLSCSAGR